LARPIWSKAKDEQIYCCGNAESFNSWSGLNAFVDQRRFDLVAFDMDGVLVNYTSCWTWVHDHFQVQNEAAIQAFIDGRIDDMEFMRRDISLWLRKRPQLCREELELILAPLPMNEGIEETIRILRTNGIRTVIVSGGLDIVAEKIASRYGFDDWLANGVECDENGKLTGEGLLRVELKNKRSALDQLLAKYGIKGDRVACVGDSFVDIPMFEACAMSIAFNPTDSMVVEKATHVVRNKSIKAVLPYILNAEG